MLAVDVIIAGDLVGLNDTSVCSNYSQEPEIVAVTEEGNNDSIEGSNASSIENGRYIGNFVSEFKTVPITLYD